MFGADLEKIESDVAAAVIDASAGSITAEDIQEINIICNRIATEKALAAASAAAVAVESNTSAAVAAAEVEAALAAVQKAAKKAARLQRKLEKALALAAFAAEAVTANNGTERLARSRQRENEGVDTAPINSLSAVAALSVATCAAFIVIVVALVGGVGFWFQKRKTRNRSTVPGTFV